MHTSVTKARMVVPEMQAEIGAMTYSTTILADSSTDDCQRFKERYRGNKSTALRLYQQPSLLSLMSLFFNSRYSANCHSLQGVRALFQRGLLVLGFVCLLGLGTADAFPPAPYYTLYGIVRDQVGQTVTAEGAEIILLKGGVEVGRTPITSSLIDRNYELNMRLDQARSGTTFYTDKATPISSPSGPSQWLFQGPPAESKFLAAERSVVSDDRPAGVGQWQNLAFEHRAIFTSKNLSDLAPASNPLFPLPVRLPSIFSSSGEEENYLH